MHQFDLSWVVDLNGQLPMIPSSQNQRASADLIEEYAISMAKQNCPTQFLPARSVRSPEDFFLGNILVDVKTRCLDRDFNMPNLISVDRARKILADSNNDIYYWMIEYRINNTGHIVVEKSEMVPIWHLSWDALSIQNLGLGQIQISKWDRLIDPAPCRLQWTQNLTDRTRKFYRALQEQLERRIKALG